jgi:hypothetical protein
MNFEENSRGHISGAIPKFSLRDSKNPTEFLLVQSLSPAEIQTLIFLFVIYRILALYAS